MWPARDAIFAALPCSGESPRYGLCETAAPMSRLNRCCRTSKQGTRPTLRDTSSLPSSLQRNWPLPNSARASMDTCGWRSGNIASAAPRNSLTAGTPLADTACYRTA